MRLTGRAAILIALVLSLATACDASGVDDGETLTPPSPTFDVTAAIMALGESQLDLIESGEQAPPSLLDWASIEQRKPLDVFEESTFCRSLSAPGVDNGLGSLIAAGINALSLRLRRRPAPDELQNVLSTAVTFAGATCPLWGPRDPPPSPPPPWYPFGYSLYVLNPNLAWQWVAREAAICPTPATPCWQMNFVTRDNCDAIWAWITAYDAVGIALAEIQAIDLLVAPDEPTTLTFETTDGRAASARLTRLTCADTTR